MKSTGKWYLALALGISPFFAVPANADTDELPPAPIPVATDLHRDGAASRVRGRPILLVVAALHCPYCTLLDEDIIKPMIRSGDYTERVFIRKLVVDNGSQVRDFNGQRINATALSARYRVSVTPTVLLLDHAGREVAERLVGINTVEFYGGYLDQAIDQARQALERQGTAVD